MKTGSMEITVEFLAGTSISEAVQQSIDMLGLLPMLAYVKFNFNGITFCVSRNSKVTNNLSERLDKVYNSGFKHWII